ncbi:hypothetical protein EWM62_06855 [Mucilaginibacter terrigena]|uniref:Uncharacterized protein n=1 Tax=Mucilaginibacter terrigena TaxID=2492395 RepID=A0A4Q5LQE0_9SPHI|nr:contractile injection system tape measure protein [Mucilaginibacter terrigena]RYU91652.1 hypothetical protein EWM62_06855 [Mucilaginibacter terrigena]
MEQREGHIISTLSWATTFDDKALGFDLQNRISQWSKFVMPGELDYVFKQICPKGMSLSINSLEIDLGEIEVKDLEAQLKKRLESTLREKLADMLSYPSPDQNLILTVQSLASMESLRYFLVNGVMPWNYNGGDLNMLVSDLFKKQQHKTIELLRETGSASIAARKRMAWQFDEPNFNETIRGFEPVSYDQINCLSGEMVRLQHKEQFVRSSVADLGKEIRLWILNYLLSDRGTIFNNLAFMRGILEQMAHRHNIDYEDLLLLVEKAIVKPNLAFHVKGEFMTVINMLSQQQKLSVHNRVSKGSQRLGTLPSEGKKAYMNLSPEELAVNIVQAGYQNSHSSLLSLPTSIEYWLKHAKKLDDRFMDVFYSACSYIWPAKVVKLIAFFSQLPDRIISRINQRAMRAVCIAYVLIYKEKINPKIFFDFFIAQCAKISGIDREEIYDKICGGLVARHLQSGLLNSKYNLIVESAQVTYTKYNTDPFADLVRNLNKYCLQVTGSVTDRRFLSLLRYDLGQLIRLDAVSILRILRGLKNRSVLFDIVPVLSNKALINILLTADKGPVPKAIDKFKTVIASTGFLAGSNEIAWLQKNALRLAFKALILQPGLPPKLFFTELIARAELSGRFNTEFLIRLRKQLGLEQIQADETDEITSSQTRYNNKKIVALLYKHLQDVKKPLTSVLDILHQYRVNHPLIHTIRSDSHLSGLLFNRFFNNGAHEVKAMVNATLNNVLKITPGLNKQSVEKKLNDLFWECFISKSWCRNGFAGLKDNFKAAVNYNYPAVAIAGIITNAPKDRVHRPEMILMDLEPSKIAELAYKVKTAITAGNNTVTWGGQRISLTEILLTAIAHQRKPGKLLVELKLSDKEIIRFLRTVDFEQVLYQLNISTPALSGRIGDLALIYFLFNTSRAGVIEDNALLNIYKQLLLLNQQQGNWRTGRDKLLNQALAVRGSRLAINDQLISKFNVAGFKVSAGMLKLLFSILPAHHQLIGRLNAAGLKSSGIAEIGYSWPADGKQDRGKGDALKTLKKDLNNAYQRNITEQLLYLIITEQRVPSWFSARPTYPVAMLAEEIICRYPHTLLNLLKTEHLNAQELKQLAGMVPFQRLIYMLSDPYHSIKPLANELECLYKVLGEMSFGTVSGRQVQMLLYRKLLLAWKSGNRALLSASHVWQELIWDLFVTYKISKDNVMLQAASRMDGLAPAYRAALRQLVTVAGAKGEKSILKIKDIPMKDKPALINKTEILSEPIPVKNAGMVLLSEYVPALFRHMNLLTGQEFANAGARLDAVHVLQYAVTGMMHTSEPYLPLNKVFCGLPLAEPVTPGITLTAKQQELISGMILNMVGQWAAIGKTSVDGFRGNWLVRDGLLSESEERWELVVEPRPYDILINQFPFSYSIIKYQWMGKPLHVKWKI